MNQEISMKREANQYQAIELDFYKHGSEVYKIN